MKLTLPGLEITIQSKAKVTFAVQKQICVSNKPEILHIVPICVLSLVLLSLLKYTLHQCQCFHNNMLFIKCDVLLLPKIITLNSKFKNLKIDSRFKKHFVFKYNITHVFHIIYLMSLCKW